MWCVPKLNDEYIERMEDILDLYERPQNESEPVVCLDELPVVLHADKRPRKPAKPGKPARYDYEYERKGTANIFCAVEPLAGKHFERVTKNRTFSEFAKFLASIERAYKYAEVIHLVMDNLSTHTVRSLEKFYGRERGREIWSRFQIHYTPRHASWLNIAEIEIGMLSRQGLGKRRYGDLAQIRTVTNAWKARANRKKTRIEWQYSTQKARKDFGYNATSITQTEH